MKILKCLFVAASLCAAPTAHAQVRATADSQVRQLLADFVKAFDDLDYPAFRKCWFDRPVVFFPSVAPDPKGGRVDDPTGFDTAWHRQFDLIRAGAAAAGRNAAPYMNIEPHDVRIDFPAPTVAVVTFHLASGNNNVGRRMFVIVNSGGAWKISHLHASNLSVSPPQ